MREQAAARTEAVYRALKTSPAIIVSHQGRDGLYILTREMSRPDEGAWRLTNFAKDGPWGHDTRHTIHELAELVARSHPTSVRAASDEDVIAWTTTPEFLAGAKRVAFIQAINALSYASSGSDRARFREIEHRAHEVFDVDPDAAIELVTSALPRKNPVAAITSAAAAGFGRAAARRAHAAGQTEPDAEPYLQVDVRKYPKLREHAEDYFRGFWDEMIGIDYPTEYVGLTENPGWVTRAISDGYETLEDRVPPRWMPRLSSVRTHRGRITARMKEYGCGAYGCVLPTLDDQVVLKVTTDTTEAEFAADLSESLVVPVVVDYKMVARLAARHEGRDIYLLWREAADQVGALSDHPAIAEQHAAAQAAYEVLRHTGRTPPKEIRAWRSAVANMAKDSRLRFLADGMLRVYDEQGIFFGDVHGGNVGLVIRHGTASWVITDPGHVSVTPTGDR